MSAITQQDGLIADFLRLRLEVVPAGTVARLLSLMVKPTLLEKIQEGQKTDAQLQLVRDKISPDRARDFSVSADGAIRFRGRICVPELPELKEEILSEAHCAPYAAHPGGTKTSLIDPHGLRLFENSRP